MPTGTVGGGASNGQPELLFTSGSDSGGEEGVNNKIRVMIISTIDIIISSGQACPPLKKSIFQAMKVWSTIL